MGDLQQYTWWEEWKRADEEVARLKAERDEARRWARFFKQEMYEYKQDYHNAADDWAEECDKVNEARRVARRFYRKYKELDKILWAEFNMIISGPKYGG